MLSYIALVACSTQPPPFAPADPVPVGAADTCGAAPYGYLIGQDATALEKVLILRQVRLIRPTTPISKDLRPTRINFTIDGNEKIKRITCG